MVSGPFLQSMQMPKFRFEFLESQNTEWVTDIDLSDDIAAIEEARRTAIEMFHDATLEKRLPLRWIVNIYHMADGTLVKSIAFGDLFTDE